ncbi:MULTISPECIES: hypothetical protein [Cyanophyceae]|uniref:hypothetical protein n=1 Tax=Cyanophyceae TaxID=3028117 RepID=UPI001683BFEE|nr:MULTISPECIES: hypothetical protein [Cyanophyceae]MBD1914736.1 hypothetical protein [Phormidium sp. FACHB-77]MBD2030839.1 hypothetical protein [Phormidium sp. FACHB-322]MBD2052438.1 hypothetical protein [Leptolyngbya sp. FACHB-60]
MAHHVLCKHCGRSIHSRQTLAVVGRTLEPLHTSCYAAYAAQQPWYRKPGRPVNYWRSLLAFNALLMLGILLLHLLVKPLTVSVGLGLRPLLVVINAWLLVARLISYWSIERHLPSSQPRGGTS